MTSKQKIYWLSRFERIEILVKRRERELEVWRSRLDEAKMNERGTHLLYVARVEKLLSLELARIARERMELEEGLKKIKDTTLRSILELRYIDTYTWAEISDILGLTYQHVYRLHKKAIKLLRVPCKIEEEIYDEMKEEEEYDKQ